MGYQDKHLSLGTCPGGDPYGPRRSSIEGPRRRRRVSEVRRLPGVLLVCALGILWACQAKPPAGVEAPKPGGVFSDVIEAIGQIEQSLPKPGDRDSDVPRDEWKLILDARQRLTVPRTVSGGTTETDYYQPEEESDTTGAGDGTQGDALDAIIDAEWEEYQNLSASMPPGTPDPELVKIAGESLTDFYKDLPVLMSVVPDTLRERVIHIVVLRYFNTILRAGVDPRLFTVMQPR